MYYPMNLTSHFAIQNAAIGKQYMRVFPKAMEVSPNCLSRFQQADDEAYLHDGMPLPEPPSNSSKIAQKK